MGATLAVALAKLPLQIAVIEAFPFRSNNQPSYDARSVALNYGSKKVFKSLAVWSELEAAASPIKKIHVSSQGQFGVTRLNAQDEGLDALGYVIENRVLGNVLLKQIEQHDNVTLICPAQLTDLSFNEDQAQVRIVQQDKSIPLNAQLIVGADGENSKVRELLDINVHKKDYQQTAIVSNVTPGKPHDNIAYERFTPEGPIAILPMTENRCSLVFTVASQASASIMELDDKDFLNELEKRFGFRTGGFSKTSKRFCYPLSLMKIDKHFKQRAVIIGNAAHALHPIAGQGFNLGVRDVASLVEVIADALRQQSDIGSSDVLALYEKARKKDQNTVARITDGLAQVFSNTLFPLTKLRSRGLLLADVIPPIKHSMAQHAMGLAGRLPRITRGLPL